MIRKTRNRIWPAARHHDLRGIPLLFLLSLSCLLLWPPAVCRSAAPWDLEKLINRALEANWDMISAQENVQKAGLNVQSAEAAFELKIYPGASFGFSGGDETSTETNVGMAVSLEKRMSFGTEIAVEPSVVRQDGDYRNRTLVRIVQPLLRGVGSDYNMSGIYSAKFSERASIRNRYQRKVTTVIGAVTHGYDVIRQRETLRLREESFQRLKEMEEATAIKERMGLVTPMDLYRVRIQLKQAEEELNLSKESYVDALDSIKIFLAMPLKEDIDVSLPLTFDRIYPEEQEMIQAAMANRVELDQVRDELAEARRLSDKSKKDILPDLDVGLTLSFDGDPSSRLLGSSPDQTTWGVSLGSSTDLMRTSEKAIYEGSLIDVQQASRKQIIVRDNIIADVKRELRNLERQDKAITNQEDRINQSRGQLELARIKFQHGMADNFNIIDAEISLRQSETRLVSAVIDYIVGQYRLRQAIGTLIQR
jgi:outer membrane protein TolC